MEFLKSRIAPNEIFSAIVAALSLVVVILFELPFAKSVFGIVKVFWILVVLDIGFCAFFWWEYFIGLKKTSDRAAYTLSSVVSLLGAIPMVGGLRWLRLLRLARLFRFMRLGIIIVNLWRKWNTNLANNPLQSLASASLVLVIIGSGGVAHFEMGVNSNVNTFIDAVWFTVVSATTVGYGDIYPITLGGRIVAMVVFLAGIGLIGSLTAAVATHLVHEPVPDVVGLDDVAAQLTKIENRLASIEGKLTSANH